MSVDAFVTMPATQVLAPGSYLILSGIQAVDGTSGVHGGAPPPVQLNAVNSINAPLGTNNNPAQIWIWNGTSLRLTDTAGGIVYLADGGGGTITEPTAVPPDQWLITPSTGGGTIGGYYFYVQNQRTGRLLTNNNGTLAIQAGNGIAWYFINPTPARPIAINLSATSATLFDNSPAGTFLASISVIMSDNNPFTGTLSVSDPTGFFAISASTLVTGRILTAADDGTHATLLHATQNGLSFSARIRVRK